MHSYCEKKISVDGSHLNALFGLFIGWSSTKGCKRSYFYPCLVLRRTQRLFLAFIGLLIAWSSTTTYTRYYLCPCLKLRIIVWVVDCMEEHKWGVKYLMSGHIWSLEYCTATLNCFRWFNSSPQHLIHSLSTICDGVIIYSFRNYFNSRVFVLVRAIIIRVTINSISLFITHDQLTHFSLSR